uniref:Uncharacterized protein n=1 Tax=Ditylenchus dipsaci TaxID=166011 RepID=A0A915CYQ1_9BILA
MSNFVELNNNAMVRFGSGAAAVKFGGDPAAVNCQLWWWICCAISQEPLDPKKATYIKASRKDGKMSKKKLRAMRPKVLYNPYDWKDYADIDEYMRGLNFKSPAVNQSTNLSLGNIPNTTEKFNVGWGNDGEDAPENAQVKHVEEPLNPDWDDDDENAPKKVEVKSVFGHRFSRRSRVSFMILLSAVLT